MASGLRARLNAIGSVSAKKTPRRNNGGVKFYTSEVPVDPRLFELDPDGLRRIGWNGTRFDVRKCLFLDTETTGLSGGAGTVAFLVGLGFIRGDRFVVEQYLMGDYPDEAEMLSKVALRMAECESVCTFNGNHFDLPLLKMRFSMCRMQSEWRDLPPIDLLIPARRTWKLRIGSCRLGRLEEFILGMPREDDLPGSEVPKRYFDYLSSGNVTLLDGIIDHNRQDIVTLGILLAHLCDMYAHPESTEEHMDLFSMGKTLERQGELKHARELYRIASIPPPVGSIRGLKGDPVAAEASWRLFLLARRNRDYESMRETLESMASRRQYREKVYIELSKMYEHIYKNPRRALRYADLSAKYIDAKDREALAKRRARLNEKINKRRT